MRMRMDTGQRRGVPEPGLWVQQARLKEEEGEEMRLTQKRMAALRQVAWGAEHFGALVTGRTTRKRDVVALFNLGLVADAGFVAMCDGDGFLLQPERYRQGWKLTAKGKAALALAKEEG